MKVSATRKNDVLHFYFDGELDEYAAKNVRRRIDVFVDDNASAQSAVFHLTNITFMDSTGIGFFIGRYKKLASYSIPAYFSDVGSEADKVLSLSGLYTVVPKIGAGGGSGAEYAYSESGKRGGNYGDGGRRK